MRELHNVLERAAILCEGDVILPEHLAIPAAASAPVAGPEEPAAAAGPRPDGDNLDELERATITRVLAESRFNKSAAAKKLGLSRGQLYQRLRKYNLGD